MTHAAIYATLDDWIAQEVLPFSLDAGADFNSAVDKMLHQLGDKIELLGFGEALHGSEELLILRNQLFQRLVERHGYSAIAIESSFPMARLVNEYVLGRGPASYEEVQENGFSHGFGKFEGNRLLVEWTRRYNANPAHPTKIQFYGFDSPTDMSADSPRKLLQVALDYLSSVDERLGREHQNRIDPLVGQDAAWENPAAALDPSQAVGLSPAAGALRLETEELHSALRVGRPEFTARSDRKCYLEALHCTTLARQLLNYHAALAQTSASRQARLLGIRAAMMAENVTYVVSTEQERGKVLLFAHNSHLKRGKVQWEWGTEKLVWYPVGAHLGEMFGSRYAVIGSAVGTSPENGIGRPEAATLEARLAAAPGPGRFIPTHQGQRLPAQEIAALPTRSGSNKNRSYVEPLNSHSFTNFDCLALLDSVTYNHKGPFLKS